MNPDATIRAWLLAAAAAVEDNETTGITEVHHLRWPDENRRADEPYITYALLSMEKKEDGHNQINTADGTTLSRRHMRTYDTLARIDIYNYQQGLSMLAQFDVAASMDVISQLFVGVAYKDVIEIIDDTTHDDHRIDYHQHMIVKFEEKAEIILDETNGVVERILWNLNEGSNVWQVDDTGAFVRTGDIPVNAAAGTLVLTPGDVEILKHSLVTAAAGTLTLTAGDVHFFGDNYSTVFDGVNDSCEITGNPSGLRITNNFSVAMWIKGSPQSGRVYISKWSTTGNQRSWWMGSHTGSDTDKLKVLLSSNGSFSTDRKSYISSITVLDGTWHLVGFTFTSNILKLIIDGVEDTLVTKAQDTTVNSLYNSTSNIFFGTDADLSAYFTGNQDEPLFCDTAVLSAADWTAIYNLGVTLDPTKLSLDATRESWYRMGDDDTHPTILDNIGSSNVTMNNMSGASFVQDTP